MSEEFFKLMMTPRDLLFCRDARPMESSWNGKGGFLPGPSTFLGALQAEYFRKFPEELAALSNRRKSNGLRSVGPFLCKEGEIYFPTPLDIAPGNKLLKLGKLEGNSDMPAFLEYVLFAPEATKGSPAPYISLREMQNYLEGKNFTLTPESDFFDRESRPGITIDPSSRTAEKSKFYYAEYLRLKPGVSLAGEAALEDSGNLGAVFEGRPLMPLGGQQTAVYLEAEKGKSLPRPQVKLSGVLVKWVLLTPAAFLQGWLPDFVDPETGAVHLKAMSGAKPERLPGEKRDDYRRRIAQNRLLIEAKLIAARVGKSVAVSGWKQKGEGDGSARNSLLFVPAGSVYYFRAADEKAAALLIDSLNSKAYSTSGGRAGSGIGICGIFTLDE